MTPKRYTITILEHTEKPVQGNVTVTNAHKVLSVRTDKDIVEGVKQLLEPARPRAYNSYSRGGDTITKGV